MYWGYEGGVYIGDMEEGCILGIWRRHVSFTQSSTMRKIRGAENENIHSHTVI